VSIFKSLTGDQTTDVHTLQLGHQGDLISQDDYTKVILPC